MFIRLSSVLSKGILKIRHGHKVLWVRFYFAVHVLSVYLQIYPKIVLIVCGLRLGLEVYSGLIPSYHLVIVIAIIRTCYVKVEQDCKIKWYKC